ncbi:F-box domain-containing protein [Mycena kentingensis (nom. inval.)]|nr:F-box domain-containing protein [Mycena kentingensis (nom. inval.)]
MPDFTESTPASRAADRAELAVLIIEIPRLEARQASIQERLAAYIYPIETIPHEIMSEIFLWYIDGGTYPSGPQFLSGDRPESLLLVCKTWRDIALATPRLWRTLKFGHGATLQRRFANPDTLLQTHVNIARRRLERSGALPIAFSVLAPEKLRGGTVGFSRASHAAILALMLEDTNPARWEYARIILERDYFGPRIEGTFHQLRVLDVVNKKGLIDSFRIAPFTSDNAPKLSTLFAWIPDLAWLTGAFPW